MLNDKVPGVSQTHHSVISTQTGPFLDFGFVRQHRIFYIGGLVEQLMDSKWAV